MNKIDYCDFRTQLISNAETVISIYHISDNEPTIHGVAKILDLIGKIDPHFAGMLTRSPKMSFSFGDKYFYPINNFSILCIPCHADDLNFWLSKNVTGNWKAIEDEFNKIQPEIAKSRHFDVSGY